MDSKSHLLNNFPNMDDLWGSVTLENLQGTWISPGGWKEIVVSGKYAYYISLLICCMERIGR